MKTLNYNLKFTVADVSRILKVEKEVVKEWEYKFSDYLSSKAKRVKGTPREFQLEDIRVMAYIFMYWENDPDIESIKIGLNLNSHYEIDLINNLMIEITPIFIDPPENIDETWKHGIIFGGLAEIADMFELANSYKKAGDKLIDIALENEEGWELFCPAVYNYRHAIELYLKAITGKEKQTHDLTYFFNILKEIIKNDFNSTIPEWFENIIIAFNDFDARGTILRYGGYLKNDNEVFIDFTHLKTLMGWLSTSFENIKRHQEIAVNLTT